MRFFGPIKLLREIRDLLELNTRLLAVLVRLVDKPPTGIHITQIGGNMLPFAPGTTGIKLQAVFLPAGSTTPTSFTVTWASSDPNVTVTADPSDSTGLTADVSITAAATVGASDSITATATGTNADGSALNVSGDFQFNIAPAPANNPTSLGITQIA